MATPSETQTSSSSSSSSLPLLDRVAIVTGASRGIGRGIALHLASLGARLVINYTSNSAQAQLLVSEINATSSSTSTTTTTPRAVAVQADVSDPDQVKSLFDSAEKFFNVQPHILVNSAGVLDPKYPHISNASVEDFDRTFSVNTRGAFLCLREAANRLKRGGGGRIISISSSMVGGLKPGFGVYAASKAAVETMIKILAKELKGTGITANCVAPGPIATDMFFSGKSEDDLKKVVDECPMGRLGEVKDVVPVVGFLAGDGSEWVNGQVIRANGGGEVTNGNFHFDGIVIVNNIAPIQWPPPIISSPLLVPMTTPTETQNPSSLPLLHRVAIVTGASRGIGRAIALHLASLGARIVVNYTSNSTQAEQVIAEINASSTSTAADAAALRAVAVRADVSDPDQVKSLFDSAEQFFNVQPHIMVNSAGVIDSTYPSISNTSIETFDRTFSVNARGTFLCLREAANRLKRGGGGRIISVTSHQMGALRPGFGAYAGSKAAVESMTQILAKELKGTGITANCVAPGPIATDMFYMGKTEEQIQKAAEENPLNRLGKPEDVAAVVGFLASDGSEWVNGQVIRANGGFV
ncbi:hypothetical protein G4B88_008990 [Cannabis sativa]|uniref:Uncharacterized protein n=2 Tax=Cannabis sativa TaxID=3483 RepID=A0A7J6HPE6_CANSA|nr:hypothetical protein G4B88_008990 [Cannabis sativa]